MKDNQALWTIIIVISVFAALDLLNIHGEDLIDSVRRLTHGGENRLLGWVVLALVIYSGYRIINFITRS